MFPTNLQFYKILKYTYGENHRFTMYIILYTEKSNQDILRIKKISKESSNNFKNIKNIL